jgi:hypothetical protein
MLIRPVKPLPMPTSTRCLRDERCDGGRGHHRVAQARDQHTRPERDGGRPLRGVAEDHPHVRIQRGGVVTPRPPVAERLGDRDVIRRGQFGRECARELDSHADPPLVTDAQARRAPTAAKQNLPPGHNGESR